MPYTPSQKKVIRRIGKIGRRRYTAPNSDGGQKLTLKEKRIIRSNYATSRIESNHQNLSGGDADSAGYRQERASLYRNPTNLSAAVNRYYDEAEQHYRGQAPWLLAAETQRPAAQYRGRYKAARGESIKLLRKHVLGKGAPKGGKSTPTRITSKTRTVPGQDNSALRKQLKLDYLANRDKPGSLLDLKRGLTEARDVPSRTEREWKVKPGKEAPPKGGRPAKGGKVQGGGGYNDTEMIVKNAVKGLPVSNFKRTPARNAAVGGSPTSDHLTTNRSSYAADVPFGSGRKIAKRLGIKNWQPGTYTRYTITGAGGKRYSVQLLERVEGHYDHSHLGVRAL